MLCFHNVIVNYGSVGNHGMQYGSCEVRWSNPKTGQRRASLDAELEEIHRSAARILLLANYCNSSIRITSTDEKKKKKEKRKREKQCLKEYQDSLFEYS